MTESVSKNTNWNTGIEKIIKKNIMVGNYLGAIDCAMKCGRVAEAFLLAYSQRETNPELFKVTTDNFFLNS
jgi:protein transport protein SEC31